MGVKSAALRFSRATDNFCTVEWRETVVSVGACCCGRCSPKIDCESPSRCATRARSSVEQCSTPRPQVAPVVAQLEELQRKLRSSALPAAQWIERGSNRIENNIIESYRIE